MDGVDSGRSQRAPDHIRPGLMEHRGALEMWQRFRFGKIEDFETRRVFEDSVFPGEYLDHLVGAQVARRRDVDDVETKGIVNVVKELAVGGKTDIIAHSHGAKMLTDAMGQVDGLVRKAILVEPGTTASGKGFVEGIKTLVVWGDYVADHPAWIPIQRVFDEAPVEKLHLPDVGIRGNSHFPMSDYNSDEVWKKVFDWLDADSSSKL